MSFYKNSINKTYRSYYTIDSDTGWYYIETGKNFDDLVPEEFRSPNKLMDKNKHLLVDGEEMTPLSDPLCRGFAVTNYGRIFNLKHSNILKSHYIQKINSLKFYLRNHTNSLSDLMAGTDYEHDIDVIMHKHKAMGWEVYNMDRYLEIYEQSK